jgi:hypothetical protein
MEDIIIKDVECRHRIPMTDGHGGRRYVIIFIDTKANTYYWVTNSPMLFTDGGVYNIKAKIDKQFNRLSYVKMILEDVESEQPDKIDAEDIVLGLAHY